jgi:hypothetical protein
MVLTEPVVAGPSSAVPVGVVLWAVWVRVPSWGSLHTVSFPVLKRSLAANRRYNTVCSVPLKARVLTLKTILGFSAAVLTLLSVGSTFLDWDRAGRNSYELLSVIERNNLLPEAVPVGALLVWWVLQPVIAMCLICTGTGLLRGNIANRWLTACAGLAHYLTMAGLSVAGRFVPGSTVWPSVTLGLSIVGLVLCVTRIIVPDGC